MAELVFFCGTMDCGKSTLALQTDHNHKSRGRAGIRFSKNDRAGAESLSSRLGLVADAVEVTDDLDFYILVGGQLGRGERIDYLICDEAQFYTTEQVDQLTVVVDDFNVDVFAFGITTDFRSKLFPGSARLLEVADRVSVLQVCGLCWCGKRATNNARTIDGVMVTEGEQVMVGDTEASAGEIGYEVLCRPHFRRRQTAFVAQAAHMSSDPLPFTND
jgi:thymidine kinase